MFWHIFFPVTNLWSITSSSLSNKARDLLPIRKFVRRMKGIKWKKVNGQISGKAANLGAFRRRDGQVQNVRKVGGVFLPEATALRLLPPPHRYGLRAHGDVRKVGPRPVWPDFKRLKYEIPVTLERRQCDQIFKRLKHETPRSLWFKVSSENAGLASKGQNLPRTDDEEKDCHFHG